MKVLFVTYPTAFAIPGGGEAQIKNTLAKVRALGVDASFYDMYAPPNFDEIAFFHIFTVCYSMELFANLAIDSGVPYVVSPILWPEEYSEQERNRIRHILLRAKSILPNSKAEVSAIIDRLDIQDVGQFHSVPNGINPEKFLSLERSHRDSSQPSVLTVANIDRRKNIHLLANACKNLNVKLTITGKIRDASYFEQIINEFKDVINYTGPVQNGSEEHMNLLKEASVFALPSLYETPGVSAIEAGAAGLPVVVTSVGAAPEYFENNAIYCDPCSMDSIKNAISQALKVKPEISENARKSFAKYTWDLAAKETVNAYQRIMGL